MARPKNIKFVKLRCTNSRKKKIKQKDKTFIEVEKKCNAENYITTKNKINTPDPLVRKKYCPVCKGTYEHKEAK